MLDAGLYFGYALVGIAIISAFFMPLIQILKSPSNLVKSGISIGVLAVVFLISYFLSGSEISPSGKLMGITEGASKLIGAGLIMFYITFVFAIVGIVFSEINKTLK
ncbi:MAG TPA: hypothetical protein PKH83_00355 [Cyclobacteriaceae bacterium]|nr:hypothetical protein [Cyclobacteriaceae bacterium]HNU40908.1 hypothetical protein [Cyclobacteriaceae bacterium]